MGFAIWYVWGKNGCKTVADYNKHTYLYLKQVVRWMGLTAGMLCLLQPFRISLLSEISKHTHTHRKRHWLKILGNNFITRLQNVLFLIFYLSQILVLARKDGKVVSSWVPSLIEIATIANVSTLDAIHTSTGTHTYKVLLWMRRQA